MGTPRPWYQIVSGNKGPKGSAEVRIYTDIGVSFWGDGITAEDFANDIAALDVEQLDIRINSYGGAAWEGVAIANAIRRHPAHTTAYVDGLAASAASYIARAADEVVISRYGQFMVHDGIGMVMGNAGELKAAADTLDKLSDSIAGMYADWAGTGGDVKSWRKRMAAETWFNAEESVAVGLADRIDENADKPEMQAVASLHAPRLGFRYPSRAEAPTPEISARTQTPLAAEAEVNNGKEGAMPTLKEGLAQKLGISADADDETTLKALDEALAERATETETEPVPAAATAEPSAEQVAAYAQAHGCSLVASDVLANLQSQAEAGAAARAQQIAEDNERVINEALNSGKITAASAPEWRNSLAANRDQTTKLLAAMPANSAVPVSELGHSTEPAAASATDDPRFKNWSF